MENIYYLVIFIIFLIVIYYFFIKPIYQFVKTEKESLKIYEMFINDKKNIIENNLYKKEKTYCYEFWKWEKRITEAFNKELIKALMKEDLTKNSEFFITLKEYERWKNNQNRGHT